jgi:hypothetical protein
MRIVAVGAVGVLSMQTFGILLDYGLMAFLTARMGGLDAILWMFVGYGIVARYASDDLMGGISE